MEDKPKSKPFTYSSSKIDLTCPSKVFDQTDNSICIKALSNYIEDD